MSEQANIKRYHIIVSGVVQGVGFRHTSYKLSQHYRFGGWIRNLSDGRVELEIQGEVAELTQFINELKILFRRSIRDMQLNDIPLLANCVEFVIRPHH